MTYVSPVVIPGHYTPLLWMIALTFIAGFTVGLMGVGTLTISYARWVENPAGEPPEGR